MSDQATDELRRYLNQVIEILQSYALSNEPINKQQADTAIKLAMVYLQWADRALDRLPCGRRNYPRSIGRMA
jgi:hypothetical protein